MEYGTITKGVGGLYTVDTENGIYLCRPRGIFRKEKISPLVGDFVDITPTEGNEGVIEVIHGRISMLKRPKVANVTQALLIFALKNPKLNLDLMDRFIISCEKENLDIVICFNKIDIIKSKSRVETDDIVSLYNKAGFKAILTSSESGEGVAELKSLLKDKVSVFAGPSGAGKSSITNLLSDNPDMETGELSQKIQRGKHTTRHSELIKICENSFIVDSPGFSSMFLEDVKKEELGLLFREFKPYVNSCRFNNCSHIDEPDCAIKENVGIGNISEMRYERYKSFYMELS